MTKARSRKRRFNPEVDAMLRKLARRFGRKTLQRFRYDDPCAYVMSFADYVRMCGTHVGYSAFVREDVVRLFVQRLPSFPAWLERPA